MADYTYQVRKIHPHHYEVSKWDDGVQPEDVYDVTINVRDVPWCNCMGFIRQKAPKEEHKHVKLVRRFIEDGCPIGAVYRLDPFNNPIREEDLGV